MISWETDPAEGRFVGSRVSGACSQHQHRTGVAKAARQREKLNCACVITTEASASPRGALGLRQPCRFIPDGAQGTGPLYPLTDQSLDGTKPWTAQIKHVSQRRIQL